MFSGGAAFALTFELVGPVVNVVVNEGDDYFTDVLNDPADFDKRRDMLWEEQYEENSIGVNNGVWSATTIGSAAVHPIYQGAHGPVGTQLQGAALVGNLGTAFPLDTNKYTSFSAISSIGLSSERSIKAIGWTKGFEDPFLGDTAQKHIWEDHYQTNTNPQIKHGSGENVLDVVDLSKNDAWSGYVTGVIYDQSPGAASGVVESYSMFRFFDPDSSPEQTVSWSYSGLPSYAGGIHYVPQVSVYIDSDTGGYDGALLARVPLYNDSGSNNLTSGHGSFTFPTAALPPGDHHFYLRLTDNVDNDTLLKASGYSSKLSINAKPKIVFTNPSYISGEDFATAKLGNPWDFNNESDVTNLVLPDSAVGKQFKDAVLESGYLKGTAFIPEGVSQSETEAQVWLNTSFPILTSKYKYLTFKMELDSSGYGNIAEKLGEGWMARVAWFNTGFPQDGSVTNDIVIYEGLNSYSVDLSKVSLEHEETSVPNSGWDSIPQATFLRLDPTEINKDTIFKLHDVKLTANPEPDYTSDEFEIKFELSAKSSVEFYIDENSSGYDGSLLGAANFESGSDNVYKFSTTELPLGEHFIYAKVTGENESSSFQYAEVPFVIREPEPASVRMPYYRLYNANNGEHHYTKDYAEYQFLGTIGWAQENIAYYIYDSAVTIDNISAKAWYRLYNPNDGLHHWTLSEAEYNYLGGLGFQQEGLVGYFFDVEVAGSVPLYRLYNPNNGAHHWTMDKNERDYIVSLGWNGEGIAGYVFTSIQ
jgi:hypothetical protein